MTSGTPGARVTCSWRFRFPWLAVPLLGFAPLAWPDDAPDDFESYRQRALEARETPGVVNYTWGFLKERGQALQGLLSSCLDHAADAPRGKLQIVFSVKEDGALSAVLVRPDADYARCVATGMTNLQFPRPPAVFSDGTLPVLIEITLKK